MLCLVDTSIWVDFFRGKSSNKTKLLHTMISNNVDIAYNGLILTEVLMGFKNDSDYEKAKKIFQKLIFLEFGHSSYILGSEIYRKARKKGLTIRTTIDCLIAATAIENNAYLLENDKDYVNIAKLSDLKLVTTKYN